LKTIWDYTELAENYVERPDYACDTLNKIFEIADLKAGSIVCDVGAGVGHMTIPMLERGFIVS
jgi:16S rRNA A1518/A1519 N6-dimethyltransferase RsmA/KsgA/DIM1 with predicted DNA glycosylase/AP lyase activity